MIGKGGGNVVMDNVIMDNVVMGNAQESEYYST